LKYVGNDVVFANCATLGGHCIVGDYVFMGGLAGVHQLRASDRRHDRRGCRRAR
jgi:acyl-[acyl carrier protein]--UDP-N-acetylglucosamine O-acyltransferase